MLVPKEYTVSGIDLGKWIRSQRMAARASSTDERLSEERFHRLTEIGMRWMMYEERKWAGGFWHAIKYYAVQGTVDADRAL